MLNMFGLPLVQLLARDVAYELVPFLQRRTLHAKLAECLEARSDIRPIPASTLAYHWTRSCENNEV